MIYSLWQDGSYPVIVGRDRLAWEKLLVGRWDTIRGAWYEKNLALADGFGNTHSSIGLTYEKFVSSGSFTDWEFILSRSKPKRVCLSQDGDRYLRIERVVQVKAIPGELKEFLELAAQVGW